MAEQRPKISFNLCLNCGGMTRQVSVVLTWEGSGSIVEYRCLRCNRILHKGLPMRQFNLFGATMTPG